MQYKIFGCKTNKYYTEKWLNTDYFQDKSWIFVASCIVTDKAKSKWIKFVKDIIKKFNNNEDKVYLSWCWTIKWWELVNDFYSNYSELIPYSDRIILLWEDPVKEWFTTKLDNFRQKMLYTRKYVIIQNWCNNYCSFCTTIQARGNHFTRNIEEILEEIKEFEKNWWGEIVLTWTNIWAWWSDNTKNYNFSKFNDLIEIILTKTTIPRIRISSLWIEYINDDLIEKFKDTRIYPHFHLSIQSGSDRILKLMNRNYSKEKLEIVLKKIRKIKRDDSVEIWIWADFIVGFPSEEDSDFEDTLNIIKKYRITKVHAFPFSAHTNHDIIPAAKFANQVQDNTKKERMKKLNILAENIRTDFLKLNSGKKLKILIEKIKDNNFSWWSENYISLNNINFKINKKNGIKVWWIYEWIYEYIEWFRENFSEN